MAFGVCKSNLKHKRLAIGRQQTTQLNTLWLLVAVALALMAAAALVAISQM
jgi:hypothetical protein